MKRISGLEFPKVTLTLEELGMAYPEDAWGIVSQPFEPKYQVIAEHDVFEWDYLEELAERRWALLRRARKERVALARRALAKQKEERKKKTKATARAEAARARKEALKAATRGEPASRAEKPPTGP